ncbi:MAG: hypothetical protein AAFN92_10935 [Bacteroidota bacterium]
MSVVPFIAYLSAFLLLVLVSATARRRKPVIVARKKVSRKPRFTGLLAFLVVAALFLAMASVVKQEVTATVTVEGEPQLTLTLP